MKHKLMTGLLSGTSAIALGLLVAAAPAQAFDEVNWTWNATIDETITKTVTIDIDIAPVGMVMLEDLQVQIGDVTATSTVSGIANNQPTGGGTVDLGTLDVQWHYGLGGVLIEDAFKSPEVEAANVDETDQPGGINGTVTATIDLGEVEVPPTASFDALTELPNIVSAATAVGNNTSISTDVAVQLHEGQFLFNVGGGTGDGVLEALASADLGGNTHQGAAGLLALLALRGDIVPAEISATSTVSDILNASVDSAATAVGNNLSVDVNPGGENALMIGDVVQFSLANVTASSSVSGVSLNSYTNLGALSRPIVNSVATAVGNNKSISVRGPVVTTP